MTDKMICIICSTLALVVSVFNLVNLVGIIKRKIKDNRANQKRHKEIKNNESSN